MQNEHTTAYALKSAVESHTIFVDGRNWLVAAHDIKRDANPSTSNDTIALSLAWAYGDDVPPSTIELEAIAENDGPSLMLDISAELV